MMPTGILLAMTTDGACMTPRAKNHRFQLGDSSFHPVLLTQTLVGTQVWQMSHMTATERWLKRPRITVLYVLLVTIFARPCSAGHPFCGLRFKRTTITDRVALMS